MVHLQKLSFTSDFTDNFIKDDRWKYLLNGLGTTLKITLGAIVIGIVLGFLIAIVRSSADKMRKANSHSNFTPSLFFNKKITFSNFIFYMVDDICKLYLTIIRGTPVVVQLMIIYYYIFATVNIDKTFTAIIAFGLNSSAYIAEIVRSGIMSIDPGQEEAGRSLGLSYPKTMLYIIAPQAFKNILPALGNEFIVLIKETSVSGYIALQDLTKGGDIIRSITYNPMALFAVAIIYLVVVMFFSWLLTILERKLRSSER